MNKIDFAVGIGGENGQGIASTGNILALIFARRGLHLNAYNAYQSIIRGGHTFLTIRTGPEKVTNMGDRIDLLIPLNQDTMALGAALSMMGIGFQALESVLAEQFKKKGEAVVSENVSVARAGYDYAAKNFKPFARPLPMTET